MTVCLKDEFNQLVDLLARQANMERWCYCLLSTLNRDLKFCNITLMIEQDNETKVIASWEKEGDFKHYSTPLSFADYNGVPVGLYEQAKYNKEFVRAYVYKPYKAIWHEGHGNWCQLVLPIQMHDRNVGYIYAETIEAKHFEANFEYVEKLLVLLSSDISARVLREEVIHHNLTRRSVEAELLAKDHSINAYLSLLRNLHEVTLALVKAPGLDELYRTAVYLGRKQLGIDRMAIFLTNFKKNEMKGTYGTDPVGNLVQRSDFTSSIPDHPLVNEALSHKDHVVVKENAPLYYGTNQVGTGWNAMIAMWNGDNCIGWLAADNLINQRILTAHQKEILKLFGAALGQQIVIKRSHDELAKLNSELEQRVQQRTQELQASNCALADANVRLERWSMQDGLTGVANRRLFDLTLKRYWKKAREKQVPLSLLMIDIDYFKAFNDTYGHLEGDACLKIIATALEQVVTPYRKSVFTRYGGEEFACLLPAIDSVQAAFIAEEMLSAISGLALEHRASQPGRVTISIGSQTLTPDGDNHPKGLISAADEALYLAKESGRGQFIQWDSSNMVKV